MLSDNTIERRFNRYKEEGVKFEKFLLEHSGLEKLKCVEHIDTTKMAPVDVERGAREWRDAADWCEYVVGTSVHRRVQAVTPEGGVASGE